jgi:hypothetical protein
VFRPVLDPGLRREKLRVAKKVTDNFPANPGRTKITPGDDAKTEAAAQELAQGRGEEAVNTWQPHRHDSCYREPRSYRQDLDPGNGCKFESAKTGDLSRVIASLDQNECGQKRVNRFQVGEPRCVPNHQGEDTRREKAQPNAHHKMASNEALSEDRKADQGWVLTDVPQHVAETNQHQRGSISGEVCLTDPPRRD